MQYYKTCQIIKIFKKKNKLILNYKININKALYRNLNQNQKKKIRIKNNKNKNKNNRILKQNNKIYQKLNKTQWKN